MSEIPESIKRTVLDIYADHWERDGLMGEAEELRRLGVAEAMRNMDENGWFDLIARALMAERHEAVLDYKTKLRLAFRKALSTLPEIAPPEIQSALSSAHMRDEFLEEGKRLQRIHGTDLVAPRVEQECAAGAWSFMRNGVLAAIRNR